MGLGLGLGLTDVSMRGGGRFPSLNLQSNRNLEDYALVNYSRTGEQTYFDSNGILQTAPANTLPPSYEYNSATGLWERKGWYIGESRTRLNTISEAPTSNENVTVTTVAHTISFYGTGTITLSGAHSATINGAGTFPENRTTLTFTPSAGTLTIAYSGTCEYVQLEQGSFASPIMVGEGSQITRGASLADITDLSWYNQDEGTFVVDYFHNGSADRGIIGLSDGTSTNRSSLRTSDDRFKRVLLDDNNIQVNDSVSETGINGENTKIALYYDSSLGELNTAINGTINTKVTGISIPTIFSQLQIGDSISSPDGQLSNPIKSLKYYPKALPNQLQALSS